MSDGYEVISDGDARNVKPSGSLATSMTVEDLEAASALVEPRTGWVRIRPDCHLDTGITVVYDILRERLCMECAECGTPLATVKVARRCCPPEGRAQ